MSDYSAIERLLGLPEGSTEKANKDLQSLLSKGIEDKTKHLNSELAKIDVIEDMNPIERVKHGITVQKLEHDKMIIRNEAFEVYRIARMLLERYKDQVDNLVDVNDRMWASGGKLLDSVTSSLDKLTNMVLRFKQEAVIDEAVNKVEDTDGGKSMSTSSWMDFVNEVKNQDNEIEGKIIE